MQFSGRGRMLCTVRAERVQSDFISRNRYNPASITDCDTLVPLGEDVRARDDAAECRL